MPRKMFWELRRKERSLWFGRRSKSILSQRHLRNKRFTTFSLESLSIWIGFKRHTFQTCHIFGQKCFNVMSPSESSLPVVHPGLSSPAGWEQPSLCLGCPSRHTHWRCTDENCTVRRNSAWNINGRGKSCPALSITNGKLRDAYR